MKKQNTPTKAKYFKYQFTKTMIVLAIAVLLLSLAGIGVSVYRIVAFGINDFSDALQSPFLIAICLLCIVIMISILVKSQYIIDDSYYIVQFGIIKSKFAIKDITSIVLNADTRKLTIYIGEEFSVLSLAISNHDEFIAALREANPNVDFSFTLAEGKEEK